VVTNAVTMVRQGLVEWTLYVTLSVGVHRPKSVIAGTGATYTAES
jgi:hypothetical protein